MHACVYIIIRLYTDMELSAHTNMNIVTVKNIHSPYLVRHWLKSGVLLIHYSFINLHCDTCLPMIVKKIFFL